MGKKRCPKKDQVKVKDGHHVDEKPGQENETMKNSSKIVNLIFILLVFQFFCKALEE